MSRVALISDLNRAFDAQADPRNVAMIRRRHAFWAQLARLHGWDLAVCDVAQLDPPQGVRGSVSWVDLPMLPRAAYTAVFDRAVAAGATCVLDLPEHVERVLGLDRFYSVLTNAGVPTYYRALSLMPKLLLSSMLLDGEEPCPATATSSKCPSKCG